MEIVRGIASRTPDVGTKLIRTASVKVTNGHINAVMVTERPVVQGV